MKEILEYLVKPLIKNVEALEVSEQVEGKVTTFTVCVQESDLGGLIGKSGNTAQAIRTLMRGFAPSKQRVLIKFEGK